MKLTITLVGSGGMYEKVIMGVRRHEVTPLGDINIYKGEDEFITYGPEEWSDLDAKDE